MMLTRIVLVAAWLILTYETVAVAFDAWPTITDAVQRHRDHPVTALAVGAVIGAMSTWVWVHLLLGGER